MLVIYVADKLMLMQMLVLSVVERRTDQARLGPISHYRESTDRVYTDDCIRLQQEHECLGKTEHATQIRGTGGKHMISEIWLRSQFFKTGTN